MVTSINNNTNTEPIDIKKAVTSPFTGLFWIKTFMYGLGLSALIFIGFGVYKAYFKKPEPNQSIQVSQGGTVVIKNENDKFKLIKGAYFGENELIKTRTEEEITFFPEGWYEVNECNSEGWSKIDKKIYGWQRLSMLDYNDFESGEPNDLTKN